VRARGLAAQQGKIVIATKALNRMICRAQSHSQFASRKHPERGDPCRPTCLDAPTLLRFGRYPKYQRGSKTELVKLCSVEQHFNHIDERWPMEAA